MAAKFATASSQGLILATPQLLAFPYTIGFWYKSTPTGVRRHLTGWDDGTSGWSLAIGSANNTVVWSYWNGSASSLAFTVTGTRTSDWNFVLARHIASTNRRFSVQASVVLHGVSTNASSATFSQINIGAGPASRLDYMDGLIAEWWMADLDVQPDGLQTDNDLLRQLAFHGPFSVPHIAPLVVEYRSFRSSVLSNADQSGEVYQRGGPRGWVAYANEPGVGEHPPLAPGYVRPNQNRRILAV